MKKIKLFGLAVALLVTTQEVFAQDQEIYYGVIHLQEGDRAEINGVHLSTGSDSLISHVAIEIIWISESFADSIFAGYVPNLKGQDASRTRISLTYGDCRNLIDLMYSCKGFCIPLIANDNQSGRIPDATPKEFSMHKVQFK